MKKSSKAVPAIIVLCIIGAFFGGNGKSKDKPSIEDPKDTVAVTSNDYKTAPPIIVVENGSEVKEESDNIESLTENMREEDIKPTQPPQTENDKTSNNLEVHYIDVGQGDATLIKCGDESMLVDAGDESKGTTVQLYLKKQGVDHLKYVVATHPDADHIGGLDVIIYKFDCGQILIPNCKNDTVSFDRLDQSMKAKGYTPHIVDVGERYTLGDARIEILSPSAEFTFSDVNDSSIVFRLDHGDNSFLFTGDATIPPQQALIYDPDLNIDVDVLKVPHHGAATAYIKGFYDEVSPEYAVISCGVGNSYGHPRQEVLDDLKRRNTQVFRTDLQGTIVAFSDGKTINFNTTPPITESSEEILTIDSFDSEPETQVTREFQHDLSETPEIGVTYVYNSNTTRFHRPGCSSVTDIKPDNRVNLTCSREELITLYPNAKPCKRCNP